MTKKAFSLIETVVAVAVFTIGVLAVVTFFAYSAKTGRYASNTSIATNLAQGFIDEESTKSYDSLTVGTTAREHAASETTDPLYHFEKQVRVNYIDINLNVSAVDTGLKEIEVNIFWPEGTGEKNVQVATIKAEK